MIITNDFKKELEKLNIKVSKKDNETLIIKRNKEVEIKISKVRRIFLNSFVSFIDNIENEN